MHKFVGFVLTSITVLLRQLNYSPLLAISDLVTSLAEKSRPYTELSV